MIFPIVLGGLFLGRAFDTDIMNTTAHWIFKEETTADNTMTVEVPFIRAEYKLIESSSDVSSVLDVSGELLLKAKKGQISLNGRGEYVQETINRDQTVELLLVVDHQTVMKTFPTYVEPCQGWQDRSSKDVGSHFIRSVIFGGTLIISYRYVANDKEEAEKIKAAVNGQLDVSGSINADVKGKLEKIDKTLAGSKTLQIKAFATTGPVKPLQTLDATFKLIERYPSMVKSMNNGLGLPVKVELVPLSILSKNYEGQLKFPSLGDVVNVAVDKYDDIRYAWELFQNFVKDDSVYDDEENAAMLDDFNLRVEKAMSAMSKAISRLDISKSDVHHFDEAFKVYGEGDINMPHRYTREIEEIINKVRKTTPKWYPYTRAITHYTHWGSINCTLPSPDPLVFGLAAASPSGASSNGANLQCLKVEPSLDSVSQDTSLRASAINGLTFLNPDGKKGPLFCAHCQLENATATVTLTAQKQCPTGMKLEYGGFLATGMNGITEPICIDNYSVDSDDKVAVNDDDETANVLTPMWIDSGDKYDNPERYIPCVVCSR